MVHSLSRLPATCLPLHVGGGIIGIEADPAAANDGDGGFSAPSGSPTPTPPGSSVPTSPVPNYATTFDPSPDSSQEVQRPRTRLQSGIVKPKQFTDGTIRYGNICSTGESRYRKLLGILTGRKQ